MSSSCSPTRTELSKGQEFGVFSPSTWRLADLGAKHAFLRAGLELGRHAGSDDRARS